MSSPKSRIPENIREKCVKHRNGACAVCQELIYLDRKIDEARQALERLQAERERYASVLNERHDPFAQRIPRELVSRVFLYCQPVLPSSSDISPDDEVSFLKAVLRLGHICQNWRRIAESTPQIWTTSRFTITDSNCIQSVVMVRQWLQRSRALPLHVELQSEASNEVEKRAAQKIITSIVAHSSRIQELGVSLVSDLFPPLLEAFEDNRFGCLDRLTVTCFNDVLELGIANAPRWMACQGIYLDLAGTDWAQLTHVEMIVMSMSDIILLFQHAPILSFFKTQGLDDDPPLPSTTFVAGSSLHTLSIGYVTSPFWNHFTFPSLDTLHIAFPRQVNHGWTPLQSLLRRSGCVIKELHFEQRSWSAQQGLVEVIKLIPSLEHLRVTFEDDPDEGLVFSALDAAAQSEDVEQATSDFLRNLKILTWTSTSDELCWSDFVGFLATMTSRPERSLQLVDLPPTHKVSEPLSDKVMYKNLMDAAGGVELRVIGVDIAVDMLDFHDPER